MGTTIDELLAQDHTNAESTKHLMLEFDSSLPQVFDSFADLQADFFDRCRWAQKIDSDARDVLLAEGRRLGLSPVELIEKIEGHEVILPKYKSAKEAWSKQFSGEVFLMISLVMRKHYLLGAADLRRAHVTVGFGHLRPEIEAMALLCLMRSKPFLADEWRSIGLDEKKGRTFFKQHQSDLKTTLHQARLADVYDGASSGALHVRMVSILRGFSRKETGPSLSLHELRPGKPASFFNVLLRYLRAQEQALTFLLNTFSDDVDDVADVEARLDDLTRRIDALYGSLQAKFGPPETWPR